MKGAATGPALGLLWAYIEYCKEVLLISIARDIISPPMTHYVEFSKLLDNNVIQ